MDSYDFSSDKAFDKTRKKGACPRKNVRLDASANRFRSGFDNNTFGTVIGGSGGTELRCGAIDERPSVAYMNQFASTYHPTIHSASTLATTDDTLEKFCGARGGPPAHFGAGPMNTNLPIGLRYT